MDLLKRKEFVFMRKKLKNIKVYIVGLLAILAFFRGHALDIALAVFFGIFILTAIIRYIISRRKRGNTYTVHLKPKAGKDIEKTNKRGFRR